ncbi:MAG: hypothetical protein WCQ47_05885 [bacterium]
MKKLICLFFVAVLIMFSACEIKYKSNVNDGSNVSSISGNVDINSSAKDITAFSFGSTTGTINAQNITVTVPCSTNVTALMPTITITGASVNPASGAVHDFTNPTTYTVTAGDNSSKDYLVTITRTCALRDVGPAGGLVFYIDPANAKLLPVGKTYLEAAPSDLNNSNLIQWSNLVSANNPPVMITGTAVGTGSTNTAAIIVQPGHTASAAKSCKDLTVGTYSDWYLPSKDEINKMYVNLKSGTDEYSVSYTPVNCLTGPSYWSSSESYLNGAWGLHNNGTLLDWGYKGYSYSVRCARAFQ